MRRFLPLFAAAFAVVLAGAANARADLIAWGYNWDRNPVSVSAGTGGVSLTNEPPNTAKGSSDVVATNLKVFSSAPDATPDTFGPNDGKYSLTVTLTDTASGQTGTLTFQGQLGGFFAHNSSNVTNHFIGATTQFLTLGNTLFTVTLDAYSPPGPPSQNNLGSISAHVDVAPAISGGGTPEPSSMVLGCLGLSFLGASAWRLRRRKVEVVK